MRLRKFNEASVDANGNINFNVEPTTIKSFPTKQDIFIVGGCRTKVSGSIKANGWFREIDITDDETSFYVKSGNKLIELVSSGHISILTKDEFESCYEEFMNYGLGDGMIIRNFQGDIKIGVCTWVPDGDFNKSMTIDIPINTKKYIQHSKEWEQAIDDYSDESLMIYLTFDGNFQSQKFDLEDSEKFI